MPNIWTGLAVIAVLLGIAIIFGYFAGMIAQGITDVGLALGIVFRNGAFLIALAVGLIGVYMFAKSAQGQKYIDRKHLPWIAIIAGAMLFLWKAPMMSVFATFQVPFTSYEIDVAWIVGAIVFAVSALVLWQAYKRKI